MKPENPFRGFTLFLNDVSLKDYDHLFEIRK